MLVAEIRILTAPLKCSKDDKFHKKNDVFQANFENTRNTYQDLVIHQKYRINIEIKCQLLL